MRAYRRVVSTSCAATTHFGGFDASGVPGAITKRDAAGALVFTPLVERTDGAEKAGENRLMQIGVFGGLLVGTQFQLGDRVSQLSMQLLPFAHAHERQKVLTMPLAELAARKRRAAVHETPSTD